MGKGKSASPTLELRRPGQPERIYELRGRALQIGRTPGQEVQLDDTRVSRHPCVWADGPMGRLT